MRYPLGSDDGVADVGIKLNNAKNGGILRDLKSKRDRLYFRNRVSYLNLGYCGNNYPRNPVSWLLGCVVEARFARADPLRKSHLQRIDNLISK